MRRWLLAALALTLPGWAGAGDVRPPYLLDTQGRRVPTTHTTCVIVGPTGTCDCRVPPGLSGLPIEKAVDALKANDLKNVRVMSPASTGRPRGFRFSVIDDTWIPCDSEILVLCKVPRVAPGASPAIARKELDGHGLRAVLAPGMSENEAVAGIGVGPDSFLECGSSVTLHPASREILSQCMLPSAGLLATLSALDTEALLRDAGFRTVTLKDQKTAGHLVASIRITTKDGTIEYGSAQASRFDCAARIEVVVGSQPRCPTGSRCPEPACPVPGVTATTTVAGLTKVLNDNHFTSIEAKADGNRLAMPLGIRPDWRIPCNTPIVVSARDDAPCKDCAKECPVPLLGAAISVDDARTALATAGFKVQMAPGARGAYKAAALDVAPGQRIRCDTLFTLRESAPPTVVTVTRVVPWPVERVVMGFVLVSTIVYLLGTLVSRIISRLPRSPGSAQEQAAEPEPGPEAEAARSPARVRARAVRDAGSHRWLSP
jgi:hypothetical protein